MRVATPEFSSEDEVGRRTDMSRKRPVAFPYRYSKTIFTFCRDFWSGANPVKIPISMMDIPVFPFSLYLRMQHKRNPQV